ncbi:methyltransferase domain-containing protein [Amycolatopsis suaedae]|uniref:methyltransferase domain-containing protein n=1 Tax=Amycolatopsis suaedae TaxID=2510978 RepID=UPI00196AE50B|nr:methyltransferase domain-containing protein [Amycolatopsis suaedae]
MSRLVAAIVAQAADRGSMSDELHFAAHDWAERRHLDHGRANLLRSLDLPPSARVLHVGAGTGALTRYLGETVAEVVAVEADAGAAEVLAARTAGLPGVTVRTGLPDGQFDVAVAIGVLEPLAKDERAGLLRELRARLRPGGTLCVAVDNRFGARALAGAPDRSTGRRWDAVEGYPFGAPARAMSRQQVITELTAAGFSVDDVLGCFPDHLVTRAVLSPELLTRYPRLAVELPRLPSPDHGHDSPRPVDEARLWAGLVEAGQADGAWNSILVLAAVSGAPAEPLWPASRLAAYFNTDRAARWCTRAEVTASGQVRRTPMLELPGEDTEVSVQAWTDPVYDGPTLVDLLVAKPWLAEDKLTAWRDLVTERAAELGSALWDLMPHNVVVTADGTLHPIDLEWRWTPATVESVVDRGLLLVAEQLAAAAWAGAGGGTVRDLAGWLGTLLGRSPDFVPAAVAREARFQALRQYGDTPVALEREEGKIRTAWYTRLDEAVVVREMPGEGG